MLLGIIIIISLTSLIISVKVIINSLRNIKFLDSQLIDIDKKLKEKEERLKNNEMYKYLNENQH